jgi:type II secretory pathway pseudopilin PulG
VERSALRAGRRRRRGFTYVGLLFVLALTGAGLAGLGEQWQLRAQREREAELLFRGGEIARALQAFASRAEVGERRPARQLDELLVDERGPRPVHHLRRLYGDPFTGAADWRLERDEAGAIAGLASSATVPALRHHPPGVELRRGADPGHATVGDWIFRPRAPTTNPPSPGAPR